MRPQKKFKPTPFPQFHELELTIESLSNQGDGVARVDVRNERLTNWVIFVPFTIPGETVRARIISNKKNCSLAELVEIITPSERRVEPKCSLFQSCGGCQYQHMDYDLQVEWKTKQVTELLKYMISTEYQVNPTIASPQPYNYRSKLTPNFRKPYNGKISNIGFVSRQGGREYLDITTCPIAMEEINLALPEERKKTHSLAKQYKKDSTLLLRGSLNSAGAERRVETDPEAVISEQVGELTFKFLAKEFFQNNPYILPAFTDYAAKQATHSENTFLIDAYCGSGLFALSLAKHFKKVAGIEVSETSTNWARQNTKLNGIDNAEFTASSAEAIFKTIDFPAKETTVLIDPPRAGCSEEFLEQLIKYGPETCVYISCEPATQMRDLKLFQDSGYKIQDIQPFDLFPQTRHLECIVTLVRDEIYTTRVRT